MPGDRARAQLLASSACISPFLHVSVSYLNVVGFLPQHLGVLTTKSLLFVFIMPRDGCCTTVFCHFALDSLVPNWERFSVLSGHRNSSPVFALHHLLVVFIYVVLNCLGPVISCMLHCLSI